MRKGRLLVSAARTIKVESKLLRWGVVCEAILHLLWLVVNASRV